MKRFIISLILATLPLNFCYSEEEKQEVEETKETACDEDKEKDEDDDEEKEEDKDKVSDRRALPAPFDSIFPSSEYLGPTIGIPNSNPTSPLTDLLWDANPCLKYYGLRFYGWINPSVNLSTSTRSNYPLQCQIVPNSFQLDQLIFIIERVPNTVQQCFVDWGFNITNLYGIDYRYTTAQGYFSQQLLLENNLYGYDPVEIYFQLYFPWFCEGMLMTLGRYYSPADIESVLAPDNYLISHSLAIGLDAVTQTGINFAVKFNNYWTVLLGLHTGDDVAPWAKGAHFPTVLAMVRWVSCDNNDSIWAGIDSFNGGRFKARHDNLQEFTFTWSHRFCPTFFTITEIYYIFQRDAVKGGTCILGPPRSWYENVGCGTPLRGYSSELGFVNYTELKINDKEYVSFRTDYLGDFNGERTGYATSYMSFTLGLCHAVNEIFDIRGEGRYEFAFHEKPYNNGRRKDQATFIVDLITRF